MEFTQAQNVPEGRPVLLCTVPQMFGAEDRLKLSDQEEVDLCKDSVHPRVNYLVLKQCLSYLYY